MKNNLDEKNINVLDGIFSEHIRYYQSGQMEGPNSSQGVHLMHGYFCSFMLYASRKRVVV